MKPFEKINAVRKISGITSTQKLILLVIATHLGENDLAFLSLTTLQAECCLARSNISKNLNRLIELGLVLRRPPSDGFKSNRYGIAFENLDSSGTLLVVEQYQSSSVPVLDQYRSATKVVAEQHPKRNINNNEKKIKESTSKASFPQPKETFYPHSLNITDTHKALAKELGLVVDDELIKFKEWHLAKGSKFVRWDMAFNSWLRKASEFNQKNVNPTQKSATTDVMMGIGYE